MQPWLLSSQQIFSDQYGRDILPHAILLNGVTGSGKSEFVQWLLHLLSCQQPQQIMNNEVTFLQHCGVCKTCLLMQSNTYPDHLSLIAEKNNLGIDDVRYANLFLQKKAHLGKFKTVLIENAETMTIAAANALLKTLEEPNENSIIILLTSDIDILLPTIVSRCRVINIKPNVGQTLLQNISNQLIRNETQFNVNNAFTNITQLPELTDKVLNEAFESFKIDYFNFLTGQQTALQLLDQLLKNEHGLRWLEQLTVNLLRKQFISTTEPVNYPILSAELLNKIYKVIINGCKVTKSYVQANKQFVCEQLILKISDEIEQTNINTQET
ncbi:DNA polymerase III subunit delta' [Colwellia sp. E150_009]|jgi:DNA polymerase-3 subunit delta'